jgi:hypothetical protein
MDEGNGHAAFAAGRRSVRRQFVAIQNRSGHTLVVTLDDDRVLHIESAEK